MSAIESSRVPEQRPARRRRRSARQTRAENVFDWVIIAFALLSITLGMILFGGSRIWSSSIPMVFVFISALLFFVRSMLRENRHFLRTPPGYLFFALFFIYAAVSIFRASVPFDAKVEWYQIGTYFFAFWIWTSISFPYKRWRFALGWTLLLISLICLYALVLHGKGLRFVVDQLRPDVYGMRASGTYICPNHFAHLLEIGLCMAVAVALMPNAGAILRIIAVYNLLVSLPVLYLSHSRSGWLGAIAGVTVTLMIVTARKSRKAFTTLIICVPLVLLILGAMLWQYAPMFKDRIITADPSQPSTAATRIVIWQDTLEMIKAEPVLGLGPGAYRWRFPQFQNNMRQQLWARYAHNEYLHLLADYGAVGFGIFAVFWVYLLGVFLRKTGGASDERDLYLLAGTIGAAVASMVHAGFDFNFHIFTNNHVLIMFAGITAGALYASGTFRCRLLGRVSRVGLSVVCGALIVFLGWGTLKTFISDAYYRKGEEALAGYRLKKGDEVKIRIKGLPEDQLIRYTVDTKGEIKLPYLEKIKIAGLTSSQLERHIEGAFEKRDVPHKVNAYVKIPVEEEGPDLRERALEYYQKAASIDPDYWEPNRRIGNVYQMKNEWTLNAELRKERAARAIEALGKAHKANPYDGHVMYGLGQVHLQNRDSKQALQWLRKAVEMEPLNPFFLNHYGLRLSEMGMHKEALQVFERTIAIEKYNEMARLNIETIKKRLAEKPNS